MTTRRERVRLAAIEEIKTTAWDLINEKGTADVTVHGIAKRMGMTPPAFYSYFKSRDELIKHLVLDAYESFQKALETARDSLPNDKIAESLMAIYLAYREWAITYPVLFGLFAGREVPGFNPPEETILQKSESINQIFLDIFHQAWQNGLLKIPIQEAGLPKAYKSQISKLKKRLGFKIPGEIMNGILHVAFLAHGIISMEISGRYQQHLADFSQLYAYQISNELKRLGLDLN